VSLRCLLGWHRFPLGPDEQDIFDYLSQRCLRCGKRRRDTRGPLGTP